MPRWPRRRRKKKQTAAIFPGQGSQKLGMARFLKPETQEKLFGTIRDVLRRDPWFVSRLIYLITLDPSDASLSKEEKIALQAELNDTRFAQLAIFNVSCGRWDEFIETAEKVPNFVFGLSLGEYGALYAARVIDLKVGNILVYNRSRLMSLASVSFDSGMMAAKKAEGIKTKEITKILKGTDILISNDNSPKRVVLSGGTNYLSDVSLLLRRKGYATQPVPVSGAFHHPKYMSGVKDGIERVFTNLEIELEKPKIPVVFNYTGGTEDDPKRIQNHLIQGVVSSVRLRESVELIIGEGISRESIFVMNEDAAINGILDDFPKLKENKNAKQA